MISNTEKGRQNGIALLGNLLASIVYSIAFIAEFIADGRPIWFPVIGIILAWLPVVLGTYFVKKDSQTDMIKHIIAIGFACLYSFSIFFTQNSGVYVFVFPMILIVCVFNDFAYMAKIIAGVVIENLITAIGGLITKSAFGFISEPNSIMQIIAVLAMTIASLSVMNALSVNAKEKVDEMATEKQHTEKALKHVTKMTEQMNRSIDVINDATNELTTSADLTQSAMHEVAQGAQETAEALQNQMVQTENIQNQIEDINLEATKVSDSMNATVDVLNTGKSDMNNLVSKVEDSVQLGVDVTSKLETLDDYIEKMHTIVGIIGEITSQTSLLALNASIEAARAGEAGKGFAVVAGEITHMATQTQEATTNITDLIDGVSSAISEVVTTVRKMISGINDQKDSAQNTVTSFGNIERNTLSIQESVNNLQCGMQELESANREIADYITKISAISQELTARANETLDASSNNAESIINISNMVTDLSSLNNND